VEPENETAPTTANQELRGHTLSPEEFEDTLNVQSLSNEPSDSVGEAIEEIDIRMDPSPQPKEIDMYVKYCIG
jgi:transcription initiation factor IIF auxiliary subunit